MQDNRSDFFKATPVCRSPNLSGWTPTEGEEEACPAFGFLRGVGDRAVAVEFRLQNGNSEWHSYNCLNSFRFNPSVGNLCCDSRPTW